MDRISQQHSLYTVITFHDLYHGSCVIYESFIIDSTVRLNTVIYNSYDRSIMTILM